MSLIKQEGKGGVQYGQMILDTLNQAIGPLTPDLIFKNLVKDYKLAKRLMGERFLRLVSGYAPNYVEKNIHIPEFQRELKKNIENSVEKLEKEGLISKEGDVMKKGMELAALSLYMEELSEMIPRGMTGTHTHRKPSHDGERDEIVPFTRGRYKDLAVRDSIKLALRRGHRALTPNDLRSNTRDSRGQCYLVYALDASGSMRGEKIAMCKKAGVALSYHAIQQQDHVGLIVFGSEVKEKVEPGKDFMHLLHTITKIRARNETNIEDTVREAIGMFPRAEVTKHLMLITDALPTRGETPEKNTLEAVSLARSHGVTISVIGITLDPKGKALARKIAELGGGRLYIAKTVKELGLLVLEDYYHATEAN